MKNNYLRALAFGALLGMISAAAFAGPNSIVLTQRNAADTGNIFRTLDNPATDGIVIFNKATNLPAYVTLGAGLSISSGVLTSTSTGPAPVNADWSATSGLSQILNKPALKTVAITGQAADLSGLAPVGISGAYQDLTGKPVYAAVALSGNYGDLAGRPALAPVATSGSYTDLQGRPILFSGAYADLTGKPALSTVATSGDYNDLANKPSIPAPYTFSFGMPVARTLALSTAYTALNAAKAATITVSPTCTAALSLTGGGTCTLQARIGIAPLNCASGTVVATWTNGNTGTLTVGLALNQTVGAPYGINLPAGASMILCAVSGTFTISAAEQSAG